MVDGSFTWIKEGWSSWSWARLESLRAAERLPSYCYHLTDRVNRFCSIDTAQKHYHGNAKHIDSK